MDKMRINRDNYLSELLLRRGNGMVKVVTGMRRSGKSYLLTKIFHEHLLGEGVRPDHILEVALDDRRKASLRDPDEMLAWIEGSMGDGGTYYLILDEVQFLGEFAEVLNSCLHIDNLDVYVTGSNSRFLSTDVITEFRGRGDEIHVFPLSFSELSSASGLPFSKALDDYLRYGGLPYILSCGTEKQKMSYLTHLFREVYVKDLVERNRLQHPAEMEELLRFYASSVGSLSSLRKLADTFLSVKGVRLSVNTIGAYSDHLEDAFLLNKVMRYDIKGRRHIDSPHKYYFVSDSASWSATTLWRTSFTMNFANGGSPSMSGTFPQQAAMAIQGRCLKSISWPTRGIAATISSPPTRFRMTRSANRRHAHC